MGEWSGFFPSSGGDRKYKTAHIAAITDALFHSGVCQNDDLTLAPAGAMTAALGAGRALVNGYHYQNDSPLNLTCGYADGRATPATPTPVRHPARPPSTGLPLS